MAAPVITGIGVVASTGHGADALWRGMTAAEAWPERAADPNAHMARPLMHFAGEPADPPVDAEGVVRSRAARFGREAAREALADAGLDAVPAARTAVVVGTGMGDAGLVEQRRVGEQPPVTGWSAPFSVAGAVGDLVGAGASVTSLSNACAASGFALAAAADLVRSGAADVVIAGGAEAYSRVALACFNRLGAVDPERCRPFDRERGGTVFGEGAAMVVVESAAHAEARGAGGYACIAGSGWSCDAHHATAPEPGGAQITRAMREALVAAGGSAASVAAVVPHGTGTSLNDLVESEALGRVLGDRVDDVPLYSLKALVGHTGGAAGALAATAATLLLRERRVPGNVPLGERDPACAVHLPADDETLAGDHVLVNAYAFGGNNVALVLQALSTREAL